MANTSVVRSILIALIMAIPLSAVEIQVATLIQRAVEPEPGWGIAAVDGVLQITRSNSSGPLTVTMKLEDASSAFPRGAVLGTDFHLFRRDPVDGVETSIVPAVDRSFPLSYVSGRSALEVRVRPISNGRLTGGMQVPFSVQPGPYVVSIPGSARIDVADSSASIRYNFGNPIAYERSTSIGTKPWVGMVGYFQIETRVMDGTLVDADSPAQFGSTFQVSTDMINRVDYEFIQSNQPITTATTPLPHTVISYNVGLGWHRSDDEDANRVGQNLMMFNTGAFVDAIQPGDILAVGNHPHFYRVLNTLPQVSWNTGATTLDYVRPVWRVHPTLWQDLTEGTPVYRIGKSGGVIDNQFPISGIPVPAPGASTNIYFNVMPYDNLLVTGGRVINLSGQTTNDYVLISPGTTDVIVADNDCVADIVRLQDATAGVRPGIARVTFTRPFAKNIPVRYTVSGTAVDPLGNAVPMTGQVVLVQGQTSVDIPVEGKPGIINGPGGSTAVIVLSSSTDFVLRSSGSTSQNPSATITILDNQATANIYPETTAALNGNGREGTTTMVPMSFRVTLSPPVGSSTLPDEMAIDYEVDPASTAVPGVNYVPISGTLIISGSVGYGSIVVPVLDDEVVAPNLSLRLRLRPGTSYNIGGAQGATVQIVDNAPNLVLQSIQSRAIEPASSELAGTPGTVRISYPGVPAGTALNRDVQVNYSIGGTAVPSLHYVQLLGSIVIPAGSLSVDIVIDPIHDPSFNASRTVTVTLEDPPLSANGLGYSGTGSSGGVTIYDARELPPTPPSSSGVPAEPNGGGCGMGTAGILLLGAVLCVVGLTRRRSSTC
jgi:hypothetical protein